MAGEPIAQGPAASAARADVLCAFIRAQTGAQGVEALDFRPLAGGAVQENDALDVRIRGGSLPGEHRFVVRSDAAATLAVSLRRWQEFEVLRVARQAGVPAPRVFWSCRDRSLLGTEFYIMERVAGSAAARDLVRDEALTATQRQALLFDLGHALAQLHQVRQSPGVLPCLPVPRGGVAHQRLAEYRGALDGFAEVHPALELGLRCLADHMPPDQPRVLCHGDFRTGNYLVHDGRLTGVLDWEFASWSDPYEDLGWMCARSWRFGQPQREAGGVGEKADLFAGYESLAGERVDPVRVAYWALMASVRWGIIAREQAGRHLSGQQVSLELALTGRLLPDIQQDLMMHLREFLTLAGESPAPAAPSVSGLPVECPADDLLEDLPRGDALLEVARNTLLHEVLPVLPKTQHYNARMVARAMSIAARELEQGGQLRQAQARCVAEFLRAEGLGAPGARGLVQHIRAEPLDRAAFSRLCGVVDELLFLKLTLSNPQRLPAASLGDRAREGTP